MCFITVCTHKTATNTACLLCLKKDSDRRAYLRTRGFTKNQKLGTMKVFYNQCQFFKHLEMHKSNSVDLGNLVLMPLPVALMDNDWSPELEIACEALMEHTFLSRIHINDWLRTYNLENMWWKLINDKSNNLICKIIKGYKGRQVFRTLEESDYFADSTFIDDILPESTCSVNSESANHVNNETNNNSGNTSENEDNPCTSNDITFVDCGEAAKGFVPEFTTSYVPKTRKTVIAKSQQKPVIKKIISVKDLKQIEKPNVSGNYTNVISLNNSNQKFTVDGLSEGAAVRQCTSYKIAQPLLKKTKINATSNQNTDIINQVLTNNHPSANNNTSAKTSITNNSSNIIQDSKTLNIASIIDQFSPSLASKNNNNNNNKIVVIENDSHKLLIRNIDTVPIKKVSCKSNNSGTNVSLQTCNTKSVNKNDWQMVIRNDKKYLIKMIKNTADNVNKSNLPFVPKTIKKPSDNILTTNIDKTYDNKAANNGTEQVVSSPSNIARSTLPSSEVSVSSVQKSTNTRTPTTSQSQKKIVYHTFNNISSEKLPSESKFSTLETVIIGLRENHFYMQVQVLDRNSVDRNIRNFTDRISSYSHQMINNFNQLNVSELQERLEHLENVKEELKTVLNFTPEDIILNEKLARVNTLQQMLEKCKKSDDNSKIDVKSEKYVDVKLVEWETESSKKNAQCVRCNKPKKPDMYIPGFSKLPKRDYDYCLCYKYVCHECQTYEGGMPRFTAHRNFHKKNPPFICPDCYIHFPSAISLEVHTWTACFHTMRKHLFCCKICNIDGFGDMESITRHFVIMHSDTKTACDLCWLVFSTYSECVEHYSKEHSTRHEPIRLVVCKISNVAVRWENYMTYLEDFRGIRKLTFFKCPFCALITVDNKHVESLLNNHLRTHHFDRLAETISREAFNYIFKVRVLDGKRYVQTSKLLPNNDTVMPKIVNTRTISSEIFECDSLLANSNDFSNANVTNTVRDDNDKKREESLPKILNVISMADLNPLPTAAKRIVLSENKSQSLQIDIVEDKKTDQCKDVEETPTEVDVFKFETMEEIEATKKSGTINSELVTLSISEKLPLIPDVNDICANLPIGDDSNLKSEANTTSRIKVVDFRKICKPDYTPFIDAEMRDARIEDTNSNCLISKPPPLTKIPQHTVEANEPNNDSENVARSRDLLLVPTVAKPKTRIAIHGTRDGDVEYTCHLCNERINTSWSVVRKHFNEKHLDECTLASIAPRALRMSRDFINGGYKAFICGEKRKADSTLGSGLLVPKKKRRWTAKKWHDTEKPTGLCVEQETAEDGEGNFKCKRCDQRCTDMSNLREHIATSHRIKNSYFICLECGENFMVTPSLQMHLKAFHGIEDPISYMNQNPLYAPGAGGDSEAEGETDNQCYVCKAIFEDKAAVDKHLRVHGMAFLNRKRIEARNAQKSPEKKITDDDKQVIKETTPKNVVKQEKSLKTLLEKLNVSSYTYHSLEIM